MKGTAKEPTIEAFKVVASALDDNLLLAKLAFFHSFSSEPQPFLKEFQSDEPLPPFLYSSLTFSMQNCMSQIVKDEVMASTKIHRIDVLE